MWPVDQLGVAGKLAPIAAQQVFMNICLCNFALRAALEFLIISIALRVVLKLFIRHLHRLLNLVFRRYHTSTNTSHGLLLVSIIINFWQIRVSENKNMKGIFIIQIHINLVSKTVSQWVSEQTWNLSNVWNEQGSQFFRFSLIKTRKSRHFWQKLENGGCFTHTFWTNCQFFPLKYKLTPVVLWKATTSIAWIGKLFRKGNYIRAVESESLKVGKSLKIGKNWIKIG